MHSLIEVCGKQIRITGKFVKIARLEADTYHFIDDPEAMSMVLIEALWNDLNKNMTPTERASVEAKRAVVARKRAYYEKLEAEGETQLAKNKSKFEQCYAKYGLPSENPQNRDPFFSLLIGKDGRVRKIEFFTGATSELKESLQKPIQAFKFSPFTDDEAVTLYILEFPHCRIAERDTLHGNIVGRLSL